MQTNKQRHKLIKKKQKLQTKIKNILFNLISDNGFLDQCILIILSPFAHHCASNQQQHGHNRGQSDNLRLRRVSTQCRLTHSSIQINRNHLLILHIQWRHRISLILFLFAIISTIIPFITWTIISAVRWRWSLNRLGCLRPRRIRWSRSFDWLGRGVRTGRGALVGRGPFVGLGVLTGRVGLATVGFVGLNAPHPVCLLVGSAVVGLFVGSGVVGLAVVGSDVVGFCDGRRVGFAVVGLCEGLNVGELVGSDTVGIAVVGLAVVGRCVGSGVVG